jgi:uncharacterized protein YndB with AHSA1/START domain
VFRAWSDPEILKKWSAPRGFSIPVSMGEFRVGGSWRATMRSAEGRDYSLIGTYREIVPPERIVFTHAWIEEDGTPGLETIVTVTFEEADGGTRLTLVQTGFDSVASREGHQGGWGETLDRLGELLAAGL